LAIILLVLVALGGLLVIGPFVVGVFSLDGARTLSAGPRLQEVVVENNHAKEKIALVEVQGIIFGGSLEPGAYGPVELVRRQLEAAAKDDNVRAVILRVNTPGGEVLAADELNRAISEFQEKNHKPVIASLASLAASGGYYVSAPCHWIVAHELTITGSIGVIMHGYNYRSLMDKVGLRPEVYKSGRFKDMLSGDRELSQISPEERQMLQKLVDDAYGRFKAMVAEGRQKAYQRNQSQGKKLVDQWEEYADGRVLSGKQAFDLGFVDELGNFKTAFNRAKQVAELKKANLVQYRIPFDLGSLFRLFGQTDARTVKLDLGVDLPRLEVGQLYFLFEPGLR
jgi:protease-4